MPKKRTIVIAILGLAVVCSLALLSLMKTRRIGQLNACIAQMYQIQCAKETYALEKHAQEGCALAPEHILEYLAPYFRDGGWYGFHCPSAASNTYTIGRIGEEPSCSVHGNFSKATARAAERQDKEIQQGK